jgi:hypothetical protein
LYIIKYVDEIPYKKSGDFDVKSAYYRIRKFMWFKTEVSVHTEIYIIGRNLIFFLCSLISEIMADGSVIWQVHAVSWFCGSIKCLFQIGENVDILHTSLTWMLSSYQ